MADLLNNVYFGFAIALQPINLLYCFLGVLIGTLVGVLPGIGPNAAMAILLPMTYQLDPVPAIIAMAGIYYGAMYGGSTTAILVNIPGEAASVITTLDGYKLALAGRAGPALAICAYSSFIAGTISVLGLMLVAPPMARFALEFGPPEYFSLIILGILLLIYLSAGSISKALAMAALGIMLSAIGTDIITGSGRFHFGIPALMDGLGIIPIIMGLFGISEVFFNLEREIKNSDTQIMKVGRLLPTLQDWRDTKWAIMRGTLIGFFLGVVPGGGAILASFTAYTIEKKISKHPEKFGHGAMEGVAAPEAANNSATGGAFIPALTLGIPSNAVMVMILATLMVHNVQPGPLLIKNHPELFWGVVTSMYVGNVMLLILNLPLIGLWLQILKIPYRILFPLIILFCVIGVYSINNSIFEINVMIVFGVLGYIFRKAGYETAPIVLAFLLGPIMENALRQSLIMADGSFVIFVTRPLSAGFLLTAALLVIISAIPFIRQKRELVGKEGAKNA